MKTLILVRHAKSSWDDASVSDFDRPLNDRGKSDAPLMAELIMKKKINPDLLVSSPANRALSTAEAYAGIFNFPSVCIIKEKSIYAAGYKELIKLIQDFDDENDCVFLFGHNPDITHLSSRLTGNRIDNVPTCGTVGIEFKVKKWADISTENGKMLFFEYPKKVKKT